MLFRTDIYEEGEELVVEIDMPGYQPGDLRVSCDGLVVRVDGERSLEGGRRVYNRRERNHTCLSRAVPLPIEVRSETVDATLQDGVLQLRMLKQAKKEMGAQRVVPIGRGVEVEGEPGELVRIPLTRAMS